MKKLLKPVRHPLFQLIGSAILLGTMGGSVAIHAVHIAAAREVGEVSPAWQASGAVPGAEAGATRAIRVGMEGEGPRGGSREAAMTVEALAEIVDRLQELKVENETLQGRLEETNRDLIEMQFRLDTHSESFRPLPVSTESLFEGPLRSSDSSPLHPLLPPK